jgi:hypothetical protein
MIRPPVMELRSRGRDRRRGNTPFAPPPGAQPDGHPDRAAREAGGDQPDQARIEMLVQRRLSCQTALTSSWRAT